MKKEIIILGDIELGGGNLTDDFISDKTLSEFINSLTKKKHPVDLILNGDTFDFIKCPYIKNGKKEFTRHISAEVSGTKLNLIHKAHKRVFTALEKFVKDKKNGLYFIIGNHDPDLFFRSVRTQVKRILKSKKNIFFSLRYRQHGVYTEHGQQYDFLNKANLSNLFLKHKGREVLNISWTSFSILSFLSLKEEHPFLERIKPYPVLFKKHKKIIKKISNRSAKHMFKSMFYYPVRYYFDPTYSFPRMLLGELYQRFKKNDWDVEKVVNKFKRKRRRSLKKNKLYVLGHIHENYLEQNDNWAIVHPDTWRDEYLFDSKNEKLIAKPKSYVQVLIDDKDEIKWSIVKVPIKRSVLVVDKVFADEKKYLRKADQEEGYKRLTYSKDDLVFAD